MVRRRETRACAYIERAVRAHTGDNGKPKREVQDVQQADKQQTFIFNTHCL